MENVFILREIESDTHQGKFKQNSKLRIARNMSSKAAYNKTEQLVRKQCITKRSHDRPAVFIELS